MKRPWILCNHLLYAIETRDVSNAAQIIDSGFDVDSVLLEGKSAISICIERGVLEIAQLLLKRGCSLSLKSPKGECPIHLAVQKNDVDMVQMLMKSRVDLTSVDVLGRTALHLACEMNAIGIVKALMAKVDVAHLKLVDYDGRTPLLHACRYASKEIVEMILPKSNVNVQDRLGESPLLECINNVNDPVAIMSLLLKAGANVHHRSLNYETALFRALYKVSFFRKNEIYEQMSQMLIDHGSSLDAKNLLCQSPLHIAAAANHEALVKKLLNCGSNVDIKDKMGFNPLFYACRIGNKRIVDMLIQSGADLYSVNWELAKSVLGLEFSSELIDYILKIPKQVQPLSILCRTTIRKSLKHRVDGDLQFLPVPSSIKKFIQLEE